LQPAYKLQGASRISTQSHILAQIGELSSLAKAPRLGPTSCNLTKDIQALRAGYCSECAVR
jgi:hypothetical protein